MANPLNIHEWVKGAKAGEQEAWNMLYRYFYPGLYSTALHICKDISTAKDMVQETCITAYLKLHQLKEPSLFAAWIRKILVRTCYRARLQKHEGNLVETLTWESEPALADKYLTEFERVNTVSNVHATLARLPELLRTTVLLRYFSERQSYQEIAGTLAIPVGTVRSRLNQARRKMAEGWQEQPGDHDFVFKESEEWNAFYNDTFSGMHHHDQYKNKFIRHLQRNIRILSPNGKISTGTSVFEKMIVADRQYGSWLIPVNVISCGNISVIENRHHNSREHPSHCPTSSVMVLYRDKKVVNRMSFHPGAQ